MVSYVVENESEEYREWNRKMIESSMKMVKLLLVMLILWSIVTVGWVIHLIIKASHPPLMASTKSYMNMKRSTVVSTVENKNKTVKYEDLKFYTLINNDPELNYWDRIKLIVGGFHQLKEDDGKVPELCFILNFTSGLDQVQIEESEAWNKVHFRNLFKIENSVIDGDSWDLVYKDAIWFSSDYAFDPIALDLRKAELMSDDLMYKDAFKKGRSIMELIYKKNLILIDFETKKEVLRVITTETNKTRTDSNRLGMLPIYKVSKTLKCHVDIKLKSIEYGASLCNVNDLIDLEKLERSFRGPKLAIGVPTTSKGMKPGETSILLSALIPSIKNTLKADELDEFRIVIFVGYDNNDEYFGNDCLRRDLKANMTKILDSSSISVVFVRLAPFQRIAMTWNMIFSIARRNCRFEYFYQVNDDLIMKTSGWLSKFSGALKGVDGIGVVGPSDSFNGFSCSLLTQAFVTNKHFEIFEGLLYPLAFRDWKSDRWLSFVYGANRTFCWTEIEATNGAKGTRYEACGFGEWKFYLNKGQETIKRYLK